MQSSEVLRNCSTPYAAWNTSTERGFRATKSNSVGHGSINDEPIGPTDIILGLRKKIAAFTLNRVPSKSVDKTPYEIWTGKIPSLSFLKIWGCEVFVKRLQSDKLTPKSDKCIFVGYPKETLGYYFYNRSEGKVFVARNRVFLEKEFLKGEKSGRTVQLEEVRDKTIGQDSTSDANVAEQVEMPMETEAPLQP